MIIPDTPRVTRIIREVWKPLSVLFIWDVLVTIVYFVLPFRAPALPLTIFGSALALFLGFRATSAYERWWEGRILWGSMINASRSLSRAITAFLDDTRDGVVALKQDVVRRQIAYVHALRCALRRQDHCPEVPIFLNADAIDELDGRNNRPNGILDGTAHRIAKAQRDGHLDTIQQSRIESILIDIANAQGGMERIKNTPLPMQYRFFPALFARMFCILLPVGLVETLGIATPVGSTIAGLMFLAVLQIGDELVDPFSNDVHDVPMSAMCRTIEIDLLQSIEQSAPAPLTAVKGVLW